MESRLLASEVFTPTAYPTHTYVQRDESHNERLLAQWLAQSTQLASVSGPSKVGKTVLVQRVVGEGRLITVNGSSIRAADDLWERVLDWLGEPHTTTATTGTADDVTTNRDGGVNVAPLGVGLSARSSTAQRASSSDGISATVGRRGLPQVVAAIANTDWAILLDDFHYIPAELQTIVAQQLKDGASRGIRICVASVPHRADNMVRALPELRGRVLAVDIDYWSQGDLLEIPRIGFGKLNLTLDTTSLAVFAAEAAGSPQLMQAICLWACNHLGIATGLAAPRDVALSRADRAEILRLTSCMTDFRSLVNALVSGPRVRNERKIYQHQSEGAGHVYLTVMRALAMDPPRLTVTNEELTERLTQLCIGEAPSKPVVASCVNTLHQIASTFAMQGPSLEWDGDAELLVVPDPYLLFYLRWSKHLERAAIASRAAANA